MLTPTQQQKPATKRAIQNENDENVGVTRLTRAKAAALGASELDVKKKTTLVRSKSTTTASTNASQIRKRAALGDVSNVAKQQDLGVDKSVKEAKKPLASKVGLVSKAAQPTRVQKLSRSQSTRSILGPKDKNTVSSELKRPASGSGAGHVSKKRHTGSSSSKVVEEETLETENAEPALQTLTSVSIEVKKTVQTEVVQEDDVKTLVEEPSTTPKELPADVMDLDAEDLDDPLMVAEYVSEIFEYLKELEVNTMANHNYMENQPDLEWQMRGILIDWLLEVHTRFRLLPETLFLAVNIIDRFLSCKVVQLDRLQLVGVTAMFIASKYEEVLSPHVTNFRHVADDGFTEEEILSAERFVLAALNYDLSYPNPMNFLRRISKADNYDVQTRTLGKYLLEISCLDHRFLEHPPSQIAAAAMYLSRLVLDRGDWVCSTFSCHQRRVKLIPLCRMLPFLTTLATLRRAFNRASFS
jgi:G2/mitotic-specific cyclin 2